MNRPTRIPKSSPPHTTAHKFWLKRDVIRFSLEKRVWVSKTTRSSAIYHTLIHTTKREESSLQKTVLSFLFLHNIFIFSVFFLSFFFETYPHQGIHSMVPLQLSQNSRNLARQQTCKIFSSSLCSWSGLKRDRISLGRMNVNKSLIIRWLKFYTKFSFEFSSNRHYWQKSISTCKTLSSHTAQKDWNFSGSRLELMTVIINWVICDHCSFKKASCSRKVVSSILPLNLLNISTFWLLAAGMQYVRKEKGSLSKDFGSSVRDQDQVYFFFFLKIMMIKKDIVAR